MKPRAKEVGKVEPIVVKSIDLAGSADLQRVTDELRDGNIVILDISSLMDENPRELKRAVDRLRDFTGRIRGDIGRLSESRIITTPEFVRIQSKETREKIKAARTSSHVLLQKKGRVNETKSEKGGSRGKAGRFKQ